MTTPIEDSTTDLTMETMAAALEVGEALERGDAMTSDELLDAWLHAEKCKSWQARYPEPQAEVDDNYWDVLEKIQDLARARWLELTTTPTKESLPTC